MNEEGGEMLAGLMATGPSMFPNLTPELAPDAEDVEREQQRALFNKSMKFKDFNVKTYDLSVVKRANAYAKLLKEIFIGIQAHTHVILFNERQFVTEGGKPRWIAHIEWGVFALEVKANPVIGTAPPNQGDTDGK